MLSNLWSDLRYRLRALLRSKAVERELDDELAFHLEREAEKHIRAGVAPAEARRLARRDFGGVDRIKEESRDVRGLSWLEVIRQDLRYAGRGLRASPGFTAAVVATLALGIGANAAMFGIIDRLLFRPPLMLRDPDQVHRVYLETNSRGRQFYASSFEYTRFQDLSRWTSSFSETAAAFQGRLAIGVGEEAREVLVSAVSASLFDLFDAPPVVGRYFRAAEDTVPRGAAVAVLSHSFWQSRYGGRNDAVGQQLQIGPTSYTIIGVAPPGFAGVQTGTPPVAFIPITTFAGTVEWIQDASDYYRTYNWGWLEMIVRRKPGVSVAAASLDLTQAYRRSWDAQRALDPGLPPQDVSRPIALAGAIQPERGPNQSSVAKVAKWVTGVALIVLLIACANVANLLLARALSRRREIGLRLALGVSRARLVSQLLTESLVLAGLGGLAGIAVAHFGGGVLERLFLPDADPTSVVDWRSAGFAVLVALLAGIATGLAPVLQARRTDVARTLKLGAREGTYQRSRTRDGLLLAQGALSVVLLVGAGLFLRSLNRVQSLRLGYDVDPLLYVSISTRGTQLANPERAQLARQLEDVAQAMPEVETASLIVALPFWLSRSTSLFVEGIDSVSRLGHFQLNAVSEEYFATMGTRLTRGRGISRDDRAEAPRVAVVSESMAKILWPGRDPLGQCIRVEADTLPCTTIVGIAEDIKNRSLTDDAGLQYYLPIEQFQPHAAELMVRVKGDAADHAAAVRKRLNREMPGMSYVGTVPFRTVVDPNLRSWKLGATMFMAFGGLAVVLAGIGLYAVIGYNVTQRTQELGVRIALGATVGDLLRLVMGQGIRFAVLGVIVGGAIALWAGKWLGPLLFDQSPRDPAVFLTVAAVLVAVAVAASAVPAFRAGRVDPNTALRAD